MKILLVNDYGYPLGGTETYFFTLKKGLEQGGHRVFTLSSNDTFTNKKIITDFQILQSGHCFNLDSYFNIINFFEFKKILSEVEPDIVHLNNIFYRISPSILFALKKYKTVMTLHDYYIICMRTNKIFPNLEICKHTLGKFCYKSRCVNRAHFINERVKRYIIKEGLKNVKLFISPSKYLKDEFEKNGINNIRFLPNPYDFKNIEPYTFKDSSVLLYMGGLEKHKGLNCLIKAMPEVIKRFPEVILQIAGTGNEEKRLKELVNELEIGNNVKFPGWVDGKMKELLLKESTVIIIPSLWPENDPMIKYEAASFGKATIASNVGGIPEFIKDGQTGFLVPPGDTEALSDKIIYVLNNKDILKKIGENLVNKIEDYKLERYVSRLEVLYKELILEKNL